jgi:hypothetical protein
MAVGQILLLGGMYSYITFGILLSIVGNTLYVHPQFFSFNHIDFILLLFTDVFGGHVVQLHGATYLKTATYPV